MTTKMMSLREAYFVLCLEAISSRKQDGLSAMEGIATPQGEHLRLAMTLPTNCHNSSERSRHSGFIELIKSIFFFREPALICFSLPTAASTLFVVS
jgi:hypothetical protein